MFNKAVLLSLWLLVLLPALAYALRPGEGSVLAPLRLAVVRAAILLGAYAVLVVEAASALRVLTAGTVLAAWIAATVATAAALVVRLARDGAVPGGRTWRRTLGAVAAAPGWQWMLACVIAILALSAAAIAIASAPNNFDSQTYHLPRIEHWVQNRTVDVYATAVHRQVDISPGAEYLLAHLRLIGGGDAAYNLVQFAAGVGAALAASRLCAQLGGGPVAQLTTVFLIATTPEILLQASSTQVDLVAAAWVACLATAALDEPTRPGRVPTRAPRSDMLFLGLALGLIAVTKTTGLLAAAPLLLIWGIARLARDGRRRSCACGLAPESCTRDATGADLRARGVTVLASAAILAIALVLVGPFLLRMQQTFGHPLGPPVLRESIGVQTQDPRLLAVNALRIAHTALDTPLRPVADAAADGIERFADVLGVDANDPAVTFGTTAFPVASWYPDEDRAAFPLTGLAAIAAAFAFLARGPALRRAYASAVVIAALLFVGTVAWQPWVNRLLVFLVVLAAPMAGILAATLAAGLARRFAGRRRTAATWTVFGTYATVAALAGVLTVAFGFPRGLAGPGSVVTADELEQRFARRPAWLLQYVDAAEAVAAAQPERVGLVQSNDSWEYPWWILLPEGVTIVPLQSVVPGAPPGDPAEVDAIVCAEALDVCAELVPEGWTLTASTVVAYALPDGSAPRDGGLAWAHATQRPRHRRRREERAPRTRTVRTRAGAALQRRRQTRPRLPGVQQPEVHAHRSGAPPG